MLLFRRRRLHIATLLRLRIEDKVPSLGIHLLKLARMDGWLGISTEGWSEILGLMVLMVMHKE
jgi:hypothetical protein